MPIPDLPGRLIPRHSDEENWLKAHVKRMCHLDNDRQAMLPLIHVKWQVALTQLLDFLEASLSVLVLRI